MMRSFALSGLLLHLCACGENRAPTAPANDPDATNASTAATQPAPALPPPGQPRPAPDTASAAEAASTDGPKSEADAALAIAKAYFRHIEARRFAEAWALRWKGEGDDKVSRQAFVDHYSAFREYHATIGNPSTAEGAAGSLYVEIPVQLYGQDKDGKAFGSAGTVTLRRVNDVPGSTAEQRQWRIYSRD